MFQDFAPENQVKRFVGKREYIRLNVKMGIAELTSYNFVRLPFPVFDILGEALMIRAEVVGQAQIQFGEFNQQTSRKVGIGAEFEGCAPAFGGQSPRVDEPLPVLPAIHRHFFWSGAVQTDVGEPCLERLWREAWRQRQRWGDNQIRLHLIHLGNHNTSSATNDKAPLRTGPPFWPETVKSRPSSMIRRIPRIREPGYSSGRPRRDGSFAKRIVFPLLPW